MAAPRSGTRSPTQDDLTPFQQAARSLESDPSIGPSLRNGLRMVREDYEARLERVKREP